MMKSPLKIPYFLALDVDDRETALNLAKKVAPFVGGFKIGPRLTYKYGESLSQELSKLAPLFVDNKFHDIPSTMIAGIKAAFSSGASFVTIHASCGAQGLKDIAALEKELNAKRYFKILAVSVLTSLNDNILPLNWKTQSIEKHVDDLATQVVECGLSGLVCSPHEIGHLRKKFNDVFLLTPGIRMPEDTKVKNDDQSRVMGPKEALAAGSSALVIGRAILEAADPAGAAQKITKIII